MVQLRKTLVLSDGVFYVYAETYLLLFTPWLFRKNVRHLLVKSASSLATHGAITCSGKSRSIFALRVPPNDHHRLYQGHRSNLFCTVFTANSNSGVFHWTGTIQTRYGD